MKVLMLSTDRRILDTGSRVRERMILYGGLVDELHIIVKNQKPNIEDQKSGNVFIYPTNSRFKLFYFRDAYKIAKSLVISRKLSVITTQDPFENGLIGLFLKKFSGASLQVQIHTDFLSPFFAAESLKNRMRVHIAKFVIGRADALRVVSERIKKSLEAARYPIPRDRVTVLPILSDMERIIRASRTEVREEDGRNFTLLMASRLTREKNIPMAIDAVAQAVKAEPRLRLIIVGEGTEKNNLQLMTHNLQLEDNIKFEPWTDDLTRYYKTADAFILTSDYEGYGMAPIEASASGLPVIMTNVGVAGELLTEENAFIIPVKDSAALAQAILQIIQNPGLSKARANKAQEVFKRLPSKSEYLNLYRLAFEDAAKKRKRLCYVMPEYRDGAHTHFSYLTEFIQAISSDFDIDLIIERGDLPRVHFGCRRVRSAASAFAPWRLIKTELLLWMARLRGYSDFYVHYSFFSAYTASWINFFTGGRVFYWNCGEPWKYKRNILREAFERLTYQLITFLVTGTKGLKKQYAAHYHISEAKIKVVPNWINSQNTKYQISNIKNDEIRHRLEIQAGQKILLFIHRLSKRKGAHYIPEITKQLSSMIHDSRFMILVIGDGPEREAINLKLKTYDLQHAVRLLGWIPHEELPDYYAITDVFIMPSDEEGFPHVLLEAMAYGVPFVASDVGGVKDIVPEAMYNYLTDPRETNVFASKIGALLLQPEKDRETLIKILRGHVRNFGLTEAKKAFADILK